MRYPIHRVMGSWEARVREYLAFRKRLGFSLRSSGDELISFARHLESSGHQGPLTAAAAAEWAQLPIQAKPLYWAWRLQAVRPFAKHLAITDARHEVPAAGMLGRAYRRGTPHIYSSDEIRALLAETQAVKPAGSLAPHTFRAFFGLLACTGLRCGEALALRREHVDLTAGRLLVLKAKLGKTRSIPLHPSTVHALRAYSARRDAMFRTPRKSDAFFLSRQGTSLKYQRVTKTFREIRARLNWRRAPLPRVHDLRHTFAVENLLRWTTSGSDVDTKIIWLTAYLGHVNVSCTYWYFSAVPALMAVAGTRFEAYAIAGGAHEPR